MGLKICQLSKHFGSIAAVNGVTLEISPGEMVGIIGRSGAGKSTLLRMINRLLEPTGGAIHFGDSEITSLRGRELLNWRTRCAMIFQQFNLVKRLDVFTNVLIGRLSYHRTLPSLMKRFSRQERAMAVQALERVDIVDQALQRWIPYPEASSRGWPLPGLSCSNRTSSWPMSRSPLWICAAPGW